jgi:DNA polymerase I-like protein with 3'-5' exonuclease and polymerase domains
LQEGSSQWPIETEPLYKIYPSADEVINVLTSHKNCWIDFDIETDYEEQNLLCFSFTFDGQVVYSVPVLNTDYKWAYTSLPFIIRALAIAIRNNILVAHNGAAFDFFVLGYKYHIPVYEVYDTMLAMHRCFPDIEKSLGHCVSYWTHQRFHKDEDSSGYFTREHLQSKLKYCAKDVFTMMLVRKAIQKYEKSIPGLSDSISCAQRSIRPYLTTMLQGILYSDKKVEELIKENDELMTQYNRIIEILIGPSGMEDVKKAIKAKAGFFAGSNKQCVRYFHEMLGYNVVGRSSITSLPTLGKKCLYKLALAQDNPVIKFICMYRQVQKETGALMFNPWKDDDGKIFPRRRVVEEI